MPEAVSAAQVVKQQQMKENARLRATLEEWSHRNVKCAPNMARLKGPASQARSRTCWHVFPCLTQIYEHKCRRLLLCPERTLPSIWCACCMRCQAPVSGFAAMGEVRSWLA